MVAHISKLQTSIAVERTLLRQFADFMIPLHLVTVGFCNKLYHIIVQLDQQQKISKPHRVADLEDREFQQKWTTDLIFVEFNVTASCFIWKEKIDVFQENNLKQQV